MTLPETSIPYIKVHRTEIETDVIKTYERMIRTEYFEMIPYLPRGITSILDIGCGLALIDVYLKKVYRDAKLYLLDGDGEPVCVSGFNETYEPYNSVAIANEIMRLNDVKVEGWLPIGYEREIEADLAISLLSWGYHYPLDTYKVNAKYFIVDIREGTADINKYFPGYRVIKKGSNYERIYYQKR